MFFVHLYIFTTFYTAVACGVSNMPRAYPNSEKVECTAKSYICFNNFFQSNTGKRQGELYFFETANL